MLHRPAMQLAAPPICGNPIVVPHLQPMERGTITFQRACVGAAALLGSEQDTHALHARPFGGVPCPVAVADARQGQVRAAQNADYHLWRRCTDARPQDPAGDHCDAGWSIWVLDIAELLRLHGAPKGIGQTVGGLALYISTSSQIPMTFNEQKAVSPGQHPAGRGTQHTGACPQSRGCHLWGPTPSAAPAQHAKQQHLVFVLRLTWLPGGC